MQGPLHAWLPKEVPFRLTADAGTTGGMDRRPGPLCQNWAGKARLCLVLASYERARRHAMKRGCHVGFHKGMRAAKPDKASPIVQELSRTRMTKDELLRRLQNHAASKGGSCLADSYLNSRTKVQWECEHGHQWHATPDSILNGKTWCRQCALDRQRSSLKQLQEHARERGGKLLSTKYTNNKAKYRWQCKLGHTWEATANTVLNCGTWCPECGQKQNCGPGEACRTCRSMQLPAEAAA